MGSRPLGAAGGYSYGLDQILRGPALGGVTERARVAHRLSLFGFFEHGQAYYTDIWKLVVNDACCIDPIELWHAHVHQYYIRQQFETKNIENISEKIHSVSIDVEGKLASENELHSNMTDYISFILKKFSGLEPVLYLFIFLHG